MSESNIQASPGSIFICYRREDSADVTGRIYDRLVDHFGAERVFMDVEAIRLGYDFRSEIDETIKVCSIVIVVIGDEWLAQVDDKRRIDDENDRVRIEIESALRREIPIIPVLTRGASHPTKAMLPASLEALAYRHGTSIRHEHFRGDVDSLISQMDKLLAHQESTPSKPAEPKEPTTPMKSTQATPATPPVPSTPSITALKKLKVSISERRILVSAIVLLLLGLAWFLVWPHHQKAAKQGNQPQIANPARVTANPEKASEPAKGQFAVQQNPAEFYQKATDKGDAQFKLGYTYYYGLGVPKDLRKAAGLYQTAADLGNAEAQFDLGMMYEVGQGVPMDLGKAAELYKKAANQDYEPATRGLSRLGDAQFKLGYTYYYGLGVPKDLRKAAELYQTAADLGNAEAQFDLDMMYEVGQGMPMDLGKAAELYKKAANQDYEPAIRGRSRLSK